MADENDDKILDRGDNVQSPLDSAGKDSAPEKAGAQATDSLEESSKLVEGEETSEEKAERERLEAEEAKKRNIRIPKARFDEAQAKARAREKALLEEIERLKGGQQASQVEQDIQKRRTELETLQDKYEDLILDGKKDEARKVRKQLENLREELIEYRTSVKSDEARRAAVDQLSYDAQLAKHESVYPELNPDNEEFDEEKTNEVAALLRTFIAAGTPRVEALNKAVKYVLGPPPEKRTSDAAKTLADERARKAREKAAEAERRQPANLNKLGADSDKAGKSGASVDVLRMRQEEFAKLDEETKARLRGDII